MFLVSLFSIFNSQRNSNFSGPSKMKTSGKVLSLLENRKRICTCLKEATDPMRGREQPPSTQITGNLNAWLRAN